MRMAEGRAPHALAQFSPEGFPNKVIFDPHGQTVKRAGQGPCHLRRFYVLEQRANPDYRRPAANGEAKLYHCAAGNPKIKGDFASSPVFPVNSFAGVGSCPRSTS